MNPDSFWMFSPALVLWGLLGAAAWHDVRSRRIPNCLVLPGTVLGLLLNTLPLPDLAPAGLLMALAGMMLGLALLLPMYALKALGAGDVKLMAMVGAFLGPRPVLLAVLFTLLSGGVLALAAAIYSGVLRKVLANTGQMLLGGLLQGTLRMTPPAATSGKLPYALAIAAGTAMYLALGAGGRLGVLA